MNTATQLSLAFGLERPRRSYLEKIASFGAIYGTQLGKTNSRKNVVKWAQENFQDLRGWIGTPYGDYFLMNVMEDIREWKKLEDARMEMAIAHAPRSSRED